jgi:hypothetical protein
MQSLIDDFSASMGVMAGPWWITPWFISAAVGFDFSPGLPMQSNRCEAGSARCGQSVATYAGDRYLAGRDTKRHRNHRVGCAVAGRLASGRLASSVAAAAFAAASDSGNNARPTFSTSVRARRSACGNIMQLMKLNSLIE